MLLDGFESGAKETPFLTISVKDYLWGYPSVLKTMDNLQKCQEESWSREEDDWADTWDDPCEDFLSDDNKPNMGIFWGRNGTALDLRKINTGSSGQCSFIRYQFSQISIGSRYRNIQTNCHPDKMDTYMESLYVFIP